MIILPQRCYNITVRKVTVITMLFKKKIKQKSYDPAKRKPAIRASICTGEQVAGFIDLESGKFEEILLIRNPKDLEEFKMTYGITGDLQIIY
ncbi:MAG: hypothetical protein IKE93_10305 [Erysipelotrichaceae bacterium]|nr:hypothetical protein [Erysipelotrichaceae bacterium]